MDQEKENINNPNMKIANMTWYHYHNYGTVCQVVALNHFIRNQGYTCNVIEYIPNGKVRENNNDNLLCEYSKKVIHKIKNHRYHNYTPDMRERKFDEFVAKHLNFTNKVTTYSDLRELNKYYDAFICGSDQIWAPSCFDPHYFLDFVEDTNRMISYAPSVGLSQIYNKDTEFQIKNLTTRFKYISTREKSGSKIISDLIGKPVETVCDPTLLLKPYDWNQFIKKKSFPWDNEKYILVYCLGHSESHWKQIYKIAEMLELDVKIIPVFTPDLKRKGCITNIAIGPEEFLSLIKNAAFICTDSFHGTAFAINYNVPFVVFSRFKPKDKINQNSRIYNILEFVGLEEQLFKGDFNIVKRNLDWDSVNKSLGKYRTHSIDYLAHALSEVEKYNKTLNSNKITHVENEYCCGCGACASVCPKECIEIIEDKKGFQTVSVDNKKCVNCGLCKTVCPFYGCDNNASLQSSNMYSYKDRDLSILKVSSSGGAAYRLSQIFISNGYAVAGCTFDIKSQHSKHILIKPYEKNKLHMLQGSKYMQSRFADVMSEIKDYHKPVAIFGTPCQISGAKKAFKNRNDIIYIDLICHGVPSYLLYQKYTEYLANKFSMNTENLEVKFRYKPKGWREIYIYSSDSEHTHIAHQNKDLYFSAFEMGQCYCNTCYECRWREDSEADIRLGDYWDMKYADDNTGVSMVIGYTEKGNEFIKMLSTTGRLKNEPVYDYYKCQQSKNNPKPVYYDRMLSDLKNKNTTLEYIDKKYVRSEIKRRDISRNIRSAVRCIKKYVKK